MRYLIIYISLIFLLMGSTSVSAQSLLYVYFGGNKDSLIHEATELINLPEPTFNSADQQIETDQ